MRTKDIAKKYGIDQKVFEYWLKESNVVRFSSGMRGVSIDDGQDIGSIVQQFQTWHAPILAEQAQQQAAQEQAARDAQAAKEQAERDKQAALASMLITSGFTFDGYTITRYSGYISGDDAIQIPRGKNSFFGSATNVGDSLMASLVKIRRNALAELKEAAYALGCNAVIGVDFDYLTLDPQTENTLNKTGVEYLPYVFGVTANGNAVVIERS